MFKEKLLIRSSGKTFIIVDPSKLVNTLGSKFPIPIEVFPHALSYVEKRTVPTGGPPKYHYVPPTEKTVLF